ncbi:MBL fold metallo-hydrolase [Lachnospiraceae bacterium 62-35]
MSQMENSIIIHRGSHQIGGCVTEIQTREHRIVIDFGANLPGSRESSVTDEELLHTVFGKKACDGVLFTHYHGDHMGLYKKIPQEIPLYIGSTAKKILEILTEKLDSIPGTVEKGLPRIQTMNCYKPGHKLYSFGNIQVTPFVVDHSALDAYMFLIEAGGKRILFTGDFRDHGVAGGYGTLEKTVRACIGEIDILITEGTMLSRSDEAKRNPVRTEADLAKQAKELFRNNKQSVILVSSTNLDSIMGFYHALPWGMDFICDAYQVKLILTAMEDKGKYYKAYRPEMIHGKPRRLYIVGDMEGLGAEKNCYEADFSILKNKGFTMLARENKRMFKEIMEYFSDPLIIYSKWEGYLDGEHADPAIREFIGNRRWKPLHTSGHAYVETIEKLLRLTNPKVVIPMHTEYAENFHEIPAFAAYQDRVKVLQDGENYCF